MITILVEFLLTIYCEQTTELLQRMRAEFVELNDFLKDCEMKEQGALDTVIQAPGRVLS